MTARNRDRVDAFLEDLGEADAPAGLAANAMRTIRDERPPRAPRVSPWLAAAAVLATAVLALTAFAWIVASPGPSPSPMASAPPSPASAASETPEPTTQPAVPQVYFDVHLDAPGIGLPGMDLVVSESSDTLTGAGSWSGGPVSGDLPRGSVLAFGPGSDDQSVVASWVGSACDYRGRLDVTGDGRTMSLHLPPTPACDAIGFIYAVELQFTEPVDPATFAGSISDDLVTPADVAIPLGAAFSDAQHGFTAWRTEPFDAVILETTDSGATWRTESLGLGTITALAVTGNGGAWAGVTCPDGGHDGCRAGLYGFDADSRLWAHVDVAWPVALSFSGDFGAALMVSAELPETRPGFVQPDLALTDDGGETWRTIRHPCGLLNTTDVARLDRDTVVVLCEGDAADGIALKELHRSTDGGRTWAKPSYAPYEGTGMHLDISADGTGWLWGVESPLLATEDGGLTWTSLDVVDGSDRQLVAADATGHGGGMVIVRDIMDETQTLYRADDGSTWAQVFAFPDVPCCGG